MSTGIAGIFAGRAQGFGLGITQVETAPETATQAEGQDQGGSGGTADFILELSETAKRLSRQENPFARALGAVSGAGAAASGEDEDDASGLTRQIREVKKRIEALRKEIEEIRQGEGSEEEKRSKAAAKEAELAALQAQLMELMKQQGGQTMSGASGGAAFYNTGSLT